jgi:cytochrome c553
MFKQTKPWLRHIRPAWLALAALLAACARADAADVALGEYLSTECVTCHQLSGKITPGIPPIAGLPQDAFINALMAYKTGQRANDVMRSVTARLTADEMAALAAYFAAQKPQGGP